ncbi:putative phosphotransferase [Acrocarpospora corrugata]|uniref:Putative phosphotransferase n=1 Tax=Acrocarpospora corrugata TaxID=35763 RepID=A0A5M3VRP0_9ACTN|nr:phosphotransferase family protein [Acrocarpospora corrugata]GER98868.1 putative phosphotransferase [Acrocarpospora corrugata]
MATVDGPGEMRTSTRDLRKLREPLRVWLTGKVRAEVELSDLGTPEANGLSSETLLFDATWAGRTTACVARLAPSAEAVPVFPAYDLGKQFEIMRAVRDLAGVPAPRPLWFEPDPDPIGTPFFVMERESGEVPPDVMPYTFGSWLMDACAADRRRLQDQTVEVLAKVHSVPVSAVPFLANGYPGESALRRHVNEQRAYYTWAHGAMPIPILEQAFDWLDAHWPADPGPDAPSWGDARIGNVIYRDFTPVAVLDWEMAGIAPREVDLGWMIFLHRFFQDLTELMELPGMPDFMTPADVCAAYADFSGHQPRDMPFYEMYAALRHGIVMARVWHRRIHFGEQPMPEDPNDLVMHRATIETLLTTTPPTN